MEQELFDEVLPLFDQYDIGSNISEIIPFGKGNINNTFKIITEGGETYLLQKMNANALPDIFGCLNNIEVITKFLKSKGENALELYLTKDKKNCVLDSTGHIWRLYDFIDDTKSYDFTTDEKVIYQCAYGFGRYDNLLKSLKTDEVSVSDKYFHNTRQKFAELNRAVGEDINQRLQYATKSVEWATNLLLDAKARGIDMFAVCDAMVLGKLPKQIVHNDTKVNNVLLNSSNEYYAVVDLDTSMPGIVLNDFADGVRSIANKCTEEEHNIDAVGVNLKSYEAYAKGFFDGYGYDLTKEEYDLLPLSPIAIAFELGCRFLTDYLDGDTFFRVVSNERDFNLVRANVQFKLCEDLIAHLDQEKQILDKIFKNK